MNPAHFPSDLGTAQGIVPGENWFFYWKISPSLWEARMAEYQVPGPLFVPIYWAIHAKDQEHFDFGETRPEANLQRLHQIATKVNREVVFLLPVTPMPFFPQGGLPSFLGKHLSLDQNGLAHVVIDPEGKLNRLYSFFDPKIYQAYRRFVWHVGDYCTRIKLPVDLRGLRAHFIQEEGMTSFISDFSPAFEQGLSRFAEQKKAVTSTDLLRQIHQVKRDYIHQVHQLYLQTAQESLGLLWNGCLDYGFVGTAPTDLFARASDEWPQQEQYFDDVFRFLSNGVIPSLSLLPKNQKGAPLEKCLKELFTPSFFEQNLNQSNLLEGDATTFIPMALFDFYSLNHSISELKKIVEDLGLYHYIQQNFRWCFKWHQHFDIDTELEESTDRIRFFFSKDLSRGQFNHVLKLFLGGNKIILDRHGIDPFLEKKLQIFLTENDLEPEMVNFLSPITLIKLEQGILLIYDSSKVNQHLAPKKLQLWQHITKFFSVKSLNIQSDEGLLYFWKVRASAHFELNYLSIRRISFYNPTSHRKRCHVQGAKSYAFLKTVDPLQASARSTPMGVDVEVSPGGSISLDFGFYEE